MMRPNEYGGNRGRGRGGGRGGGTRGRGGMTRINLGAVPRPPQTPCEDPRYLPFPRLMGKNENGTMTLDEELLRTIISFFTVNASGYTDFNLIAKKLQDDHPELMGCLHNSKPHLWAYIRCYSEQFGVDQDPRLPWGVWYLSKCKIVAKADRHRYNRELTEGNIRPIPDSEIAWNRVRYNVNMEQKAVAYIGAILHQLYGGNCISTARQLDIRKLAAVVRPAYGFPEDICSYIGDPDDFLSKRRHFFNNFGSQFALQPEAYTGTIRWLTVFLKERGNPCPPMHLFDYFRSGREIGEQGRKAIGFGESSSFDDFLSFLHQHKLLFRLLMREDRVLLRHDLVPIVTTNDIMAVPPFKDLDQMREFLEESPDNQTGAGFGFGAADTANTNTANAAIAGQTQVEDNNDVEISDFYSASDSQEIYMVPSTRASSAIGAVVQATVRPVNQPVSTRQENRSPAIEVPPVAVNGAAAINMAAMPHGLPQRGMIRWGARPPRASVHCRPTPAGRQVFGHLHGQAGNMPVVNGLGPTNGASRSILKEMEDELNDIE